MKQELILIKVGEIALKGLNRRTFEDVLMKNIKRHLAPLGKFEVRSAQSTIYVRPLEEGVDLDDACERVGKVFGIAAYSRACMAKKDMDDITVTDIASRAIINRKTFYNNYRGVYELVDELENEVIRTFDTAMQEIDFVENPYAVFMKLTEIINSDMDFYGALLRSSRNAGLTHKIRLTLQQKAQERFESRIDLPPERISVMMDYAVSGMVAVYQSWFNSERRQSIEEISDIASRMCLTGLRGAAADARLKE